MAYTGPSIVDYLKDTGQASDFTSRTALATQKGIQNYTGTAEQNTQLLNLLRTPAAPPAPIVTQTTQTITPKSLETATPSVIPPATPPNGTEADQQMAGMKTFIDAYQKNIAGTETPEAKQAKEFQDKMVSLLQDQGTLMTEQQTLAQQAGIPEMNKKLSEYNTQMLVKNAEIDALTKAYEKENQIVEGKPITLNRISGQQAQNYKMYVAQKNELAAQAMIIQAQAQGLQGQITQAQSTIDNAINLKYKVNENNLKVLQAQLDAITPELNKQEKDRATALQLWLNQEEQKIADKKAEDKSIQGVVLDAVKAGITDQNVLGKIGKATTYAEALQLLGTNMPTSASQDLQFISGTANQQAGTFNKATGVFTPIRGTSKGGVSGGGTATYSGGGGTTGTGGGVTGTGAVTLNTNDLETAFKFATSNFAKDARNNAGNTFYGFINSGNTEAARQYIDKLLMDKLPGGQKDEISTMQTVSSLADEVLKFQKDGSLPGIGSYGQGTLKSYLAQVGFGSEQGKTVRALIGNIKGTVAKLRGGTSFTPTEESLLNTYTPSINDAPNVALNKLRNLQEFIIKKRTQTLYGGISLSNPGTSQSGTGISDIKSKYNLSY